MHALKVAFVILEVVLLFNLVIFVHELGHFLAARWRGMKVERFAIWFGKPIWKKRIGGVEYALGTIPAGGYVLLPQMATMEAIEGKGETSAESLPQVSALDKIIVAFAGPLFSFGLAVAFATIVTMVGHPVSDADSTTTIGWVVKDGPAEKAGLKPGDKILEIDGVKVTKWGTFGPSVTWRVVSSTGETIAVKVDREGKELTFNITPFHEPTKAWQRKSLRVIKIMPTQIPIVGEVLTNSPAQMAGLQPGDEIRTVNGVRIHHPIALVNEVEDHPKDPVHLQVDRHGKMVEVTVIPEVPVIPADSKADIGIAWDYSGQIHDSHPSVVEQVSNSVNAMLSTFGALFNKKSDIKAQHLGGAVMIMRVYFTLFDNEDGWRLAIWFSVIFNVNLALLNLLPFPVLDGGHIVLAIFESIRRRPVSASVLQHLQTTCAVLLILYMAYIAIYDVQDLISGSKEKYVTPQFAPKSALVK